MESEKEIKKIIYHEAIKQKNIEKLIFEHKNERDHLTNKWENKIKLI